MRPATHFRIGGRTIGPGHPCFIIAEAGSNHDGNLDQAFQLIDVAAAAGADAVKFQMFRAGKLYPKSAGESEYLKVKRPIYDIIREMETPLDWIPQLATAAKRCGLEFMASAFDEESLDALNRYVPAHKIASYEMTHLPLVRHAARSGKPVIISTGTASLEEVAETVDAFLMTGNRELALLQCTASYPAPVETLNVRALVTLNGRFGLSAGLSDHSRDPVVGPVAAVACGARIIEKHFTLSNTLEGPDHRYAVEPLELKLMVRRVRDAERALGDGVKRVLPVEEELRRFARRSLFAVKPIAAGEFFSITNIAVLRCGNLAAGLEPKYYPEILGRRSRHTIAAESAIQKDDVE